MLGDFNLVLRESEVKNRLYSAQEKRVSAFVTNLLETTRMTDVWNSHQGFTWRRPGTDSFSTIDRIAYSTGSLKTLSVKDNWALSFSDHAAVEANFSIVSNLKGQKSRITRLDPV